MDEAGIEALLQRGFCGRLATVGIDGAPYCTTLLYVWMDGRIHMHGTRARGHLRANIEHEARACFAIDEPGEVFDYGRFECDTTVSYASVVAFGRVTVVDDAAIKQRFFAALMAKYRATGTLRPKDFFPLIDQIALYQLAIDRITGKQIVLARHRRPVAGARPQQDAERAAAGLTVSGPSSWACASRRRLSALRPCPRCWPWRRRPDSCRLRIAISSAGTSSERITTCLVARTDIGEHSRIVLAQRRAAAISSACGTTSVTKPSS